MRAAANERERAGWLKCNFLCCLPLFALWVQSASGAIPGHPEIVVACDARSNLVAQFDPWPFRLSRFPGVSGYAAGMPGFASLFEPLPQEGLFPPHPQSDIAFVLVDADAGMAVLNDHGSAPMQPGETFHFGKPYFDSHPLWNITNESGPPTYSLRLRLRDLSGRYHDSEVFAPRFTSETSDLYSCPMQCKDGAVFKTTGQCSVCGMRLKLLSGGNYQVKVTAQQTGLDAGQVAPGSETLLKFEITTPQGTPVSDLEVVHEKLLHLLMVSEDLSWFAHEHPKMERDGVFSLTLTFPHAGAYTLFHDFTPARAGMQVVPVELTAMGQRPPRVPLIPDRQRTRLVDGYKIELRAEPVLRSLQMQHLTFWLEQDGAPVEDLEPYLGALGHLIVISEDRKSFVHSHPLPSRVSEARTAAKATGGPEIVFSAQFPKPGVYKAWGQFQHRGRVITAPFVFGVLPPAK